MATKCACPECPNTVVTRLQAKLDRIQVQMLGYFCKNCIYVKCAAKHKKRTPRPPVKRPPMCPGCEIPHDPPLHEIG